MRVPLTSPVLAPSSRDFSYSTSSASRSPPRLSTRPCPRSSASSCVRKPPPAALPPAVDLPPVACCAANLRLRPFSEPQDPARFGVQLPSFNHAASQYSMVPRGSTPAAPSHLRSAYISAILAIHLTRVTHCCGPP
ncbi:hypothetical protein PF003_g39067 [Phytophthora fragariae]|nr:hypothetical protein PF003_g39067 [Phytophthora fragariae]